jgi:hypothetical protein
LHHCTADGMALLSPQCTHTYMRTSFTHAHNYDQLVYTTYTNTEFTHALPSPPFTHTHTHIRTLHTPHSIIPGLFAVSGSSRQVSWCSLSTSRILLPTHTGTASTDTDTEKQKEVNKAVHGNTQAEKLVLIKM